jgi:hypothetical protein
MRRILRRRHDNRIGLRGEVPIIRSWPFTQREASRLPSRNRQHEPQGRLEKPHVGAGRPTRRFDRKRQPHPIERLYGYSSSVGGDLCQIPASGLVSLQGGDPCPNTEQLAGPTVVPIQPFPDWHSQWAESVPTPQKHEYVDSSFALGHPRLRKTPADRLVTLERAEVQRVRFRH